MQKYLISIIVPVYKTEKFIDQCVQSLVEQTYKNLEIILVDDGSPDNCPYICDEWAKKDNRIKVIHKKNGGLSSARNAGVAEATGDFIGFVDSDDYVDKTMYQKLLDTLLESDFKISCCYYSLVTDGTVKRIQKNTGRYELDAGESLREFFLIGKVGGAMWDKLFSKELIGLLDFAEGENNEDYPLFIPLIMNSGGIAHVGESLYNYRRVGTGITSTYVTTDTSCILKHFDEMEEQLKNYKLDAYIGYFKLFCAKTALGIALELSKNKEKLSEKNSETYPRYMKIVRSNIWRFVFSAHTTFKNKALYTLVATNTFRPIYKILRRL